MKGCDIIGMTVTGAAMRANLLGIKPKDIKVYTRIHKVEQYAFGKTLRLLASERKLRPPRVLRKSLTLVESSKLPPDHFTVHSMGI